MLHNTRGFSYNSLIVLKRIMTQTRSHLQQISNFIFLEFSLPFLTLTIHMWQVKLTWCNCKRFLLQWGHLHGQSVNLLLLPFSFNDETLLCKRASLNTMFFIADLTEVTVNTTLTLSNSKSKMEDDITRYYNTFRPLANKPIWFNGAAHT